jgi:esterase/lipase superfamily enzyme
MARRCLRQLALAAVLLAPAAAGAQSTDLLLAYKNFEAAKAADKVSDALKFGNAAVKLTEEAGDKPALAELLRNLGDYSAQVNRDDAAAEYYGRALALQESTLGPQNPDLVPTLAALAELRIKAKRFTDAAALELRILDIERSTYGEHHENVSATLGKLREIYRSAGDTEGMARMDAQLLKAATTERALPKARRYKQNQGFATVRVFYGTNRAPTGDVKPAVYYGKARGDLQYGYLDVTIPQVHKEAELETQPRWTEVVLDASEARRRYVLLEKITPLAKDAFITALQLQVKASPSKDVFIFVHGFNNTFEDAARRSAQLTYDLDFDGTPLLYSWPSQGSATAYTVDEAAVGISGRKMAEFLETVVAQSGAARVHILAHSMGNRALLEALQTYLAKRAPGNRQHLFGQIVFTAPDVDRDYFMDAIEPLRVSADRITLYASNNDYALRSSQFLHGAPRAGTAGDDVIIRLAGLDTIDMSAVPADALGHSYFAANAGTIFDIFRLLWRGDPPPQRCGMSDRKVTGPLAVWVFNADACKGDDMLEAGVMLKRFGDLAKARVMENISTLTDPSEKAEWSRVLDRLNGLLAPGAVPGGIPVGAPVK